jgi:hypothetical protein
MKLLLLAMLLELAGQTRNIGTIEGSMTLYGSAIPIPNSQIFVPPGRRRQRTSNNNGCFWTLLIQGGSTRPAGMSSMQTPRDTRDPIREMPQGFFCRTAERCKEFSPGLSAKRATPGNGIRYVLATLRVAGNSKI